MSQKLLSSGAWTLQVKFNYTVYSNCGQHRPIQNLKFSSWTTAIFTVLAFYWRLDKNFLSFSNCRDHVELHLLFIYNDMMCESGSKENETRIRNL